ncbi:MAG: DNA-3-methyladenine glycosylase I [Deltaproteobacteria bacterium]|nr:DNA-3-methyladenine glycosylase I [Deltaproteobacteria bacterium]
MSDFAPILARAQNRKGGPDALQELLDGYRTEGDPRAWPDDRWLSRMAKHVMAAGFQWRVVEAMWPAHEEHLFGFQPEPVAFMSDTDIDRIADTKGVIGHRPKLAAIRDNARMMLDVVADHGSFGDFVADWPEDDRVGLFLWLKTHGGRLGGMTGPYLLRAMGVDTFLFTKDVGEALVDAKIIDRPPTTKKRMLAAQEAFLRWREETGLSLTDLSRVLAYSTGEQRT